MCKGFSATVTKQRVCYLLTSNSHTEIDEEFNINDAKPIEFRNHVHVECWPKGSLTSTEPKDWDVHVDEIGTLPGWYLPDKESDRVLWVLFNVIIPSWIKEGVKSNLDLRGIQVSDLGQLQSVGEYLDLEGTQVSDLGQLQSVGGYLDLRGTQVSDLGQLQSVGGYLDLRGTQVTKEQVAKIKINGNVYF